MPRIHWAVRCHGHRPGGQPCRAWAVRGAYVCRVHGGALRRTRQAATVRLARIVVNRALDHAEVRWRRRVLDWQTDRILVTAHLRGIPVEEVTTVDIIMCHVVHGVPPLDWQAPKISDIPFDRRVTRYFRTW